jgi:HK97 family phage major capsid protein
VADFDAGPQRGKGQLCGYPLIKSTQVSNARVKGSGTNLTYILGGDFSDYVLAMGGVIEFAVSPYGDTAFSQDQTVIRAIQYVDGAPRHENSFVYVDNLLVA